MGGVYVGPYNITVNGQSEAVICDDALSVVYSDQSWIAKTSSISGGLSQALWTGVTIGVGVDGNRDAIHLKRKQEYLAVQYLAHLIMNNLKNPIAVGEIQWAIWDLTDPGLINQSNNKKILGSEPWGNVSAYL